MAERSLRLSPFLPCSICRCAEKGGESLRLSVYHDCIFPLFPYVVRVCHLCPDLDGLPSHFHPIQDDVYYKRKTHTTGFLTTCKFQTRHIVQSRPDGVANSILAVGRDDYLQANTAISLRLICPRLTRLGVSQTRLDLVFRIEISAYFL